MRCGWALQAWIEEMSLFVKTLDPLHMLTVGEEGFYSSTCSRVHLNPGSGSRRTGIASSPWALMEGQDFVANHAVGQSAAVFRFHRRQRPRVKTRVESPLGFRRYPVYVCFLTRRPTSALYYCEP